MSGWTQIGEYVTPSTTASKKHYLRIAVNASATLAGSISTTDHANISYFFTGGEIQEKAGHSHPAGTIFSQTVPVTSSVGFFALISGYGSGALDTPVSASYVYGSKATPSITPSFKGGYLRPDKANTFSFTSNYVSNIDEQYTIKNGVFYYKQSTASSYTSKSFTGASYTLPANSLVTGKTYNVYAVLTMDDNSTTQVNMSNISTVATPTVTSSFKGGYLRPDVANSMTFTASYPSSVTDPPKVKSGIFYYKLSTASSYTSRSFTGDTFTLPANSLTTGNTYNAYAVVTMQDGATGRFNFNDISTVDATPSVTPIAPINEVHYGTATFRWEYSISTGTAQRAYTLQVSPDGSTWTTLSDHVATSATTLTTDVSVSGMVYWRVRVYNQDDLASAWSEVVSFVNNIPPAAPTITSISATGRPVITWAASNQIAYQVQILLNGEVVEDSGAIYSSGSLYRAQEYLADNTYTVRVRIFNMYGRVSDWAEDQYTEAGGVTPPEFTVTSTDDGALIEITAVPSVSTYYVKRNGALIGRAVNGRYVDKFASGPTTYTVVAVTTEDYDAMSTQTVNIEIESNMLITESGEVFEVNHRLGSPVGVSKQVNAVFDTAEFIGASTPEHHFAKMREARFTVVFKDYVDAESLLGQTVFYADMYGNGDWCAVTSVGRVESRYGNETTAELQVTRHTETAAYD